MMAIAAAELVTVVVVTYFSEKSTVGCSVTIAVSQQAVLPRRRSHFFSLWVKYAPVRVCARSRMRPFAGAVKLNLLFFPRSRRLAMSIETTLRSSQTTYSRSC